MDHTETKSTQQLSHDSVVVGVIVGVKNRNIPMVSFPGCPVEQGIAARSTVSFESGDIGRQVALLFESGQINKPMVIGKIQVPGVVEEVEDFTQLPVEEITEEIALEPALEPLQAVVDGETITLQAEQQLVLKCGRASITLTKAGKIILRGAYVLTRSSGVNKIKGASVQIN